ncbi:hypothetical protein [Candidatus Methylomirabilis sp.]|uniref:hypothetical protein n=1 Tax=Candidatus Methylomirabilis sp. TaxID=2032687 RepID=UPI0030762F74
MKKLLAAAVALVALAAFTGLGVAQEKKTGGKPVEPSAIPWADKIILSSTANVVSKASCPVTARPGSSINASWTFSGQAVNFIPPAAVLSPPPPWVTDTKGEVKVTIKGGQTVQATIQTPKGTVTSNSFACSGQYPAR